MTARGEFDLIASLVERLPAAGPGIRVGSGDDAAVTEPSGRARVTTVDAIVEGVHFRLGEFTPAAVGRKALAAALSDLAAMGAEPGEAYIALGVPEHVGEQDLIELADGLAEVAGREGLAVAGGDLTRAPALSLAVTCVGREPEGGRVVRRAGARPGELLAVSGELGGAAAALRVLAGEADPELDPAEREALLARQLDPHPRVAAGLALAAAGASAMIDVSDGLGADAAHLASAGGVRIEIDTELVPIAPGVAAVAGGAEAAVAMALAGGEDFELLAAIPADRWEAAEAGVRGAGVGLTRIGSVAEGAAAVVDQTGRDRGGEGFDHIRGSRSRSGGPGSGGSGSG